jgi:guanylate kinase
MSTAAAIPAGGLVFIISAPSGSGKTTLTNELRKLVPQLEFSISYTTRCPRGSEQNGREYFFVSREEFERMLSAGEFLEHAQVFGNFYGTARRFLAEARRRGNDLLLDIDVQGGAQVKAKLPGSASIFVLPPSRHELEWRLKNRSRAEGAYDPQVIEKRLQMAAKEIENYSNYDYIVVNDRLEQSTDELKAIVLAERLSHSRAPVEASGSRKLLEIAERCRLQNALPRIRDILASFNLPPAPQGRGTNA